MAEPIRAGMKAVLLCALCSLVLMTWNFLTHRNAYRTLGRLGIDAIDVIDDNALQRERDQAGKLHRRQNVREIIALILLAIEVSIPVLTVVL
jgi:hypothetical protein